MRDQSNRLTWFTAVVTLALLALCVPMYRLTVAQSAWVSRADENMLRELTTFGPRGTIVDAKGRPLATSEPAFAAVLIDQDPKKAQAMMPKLSLLLAGGDAAKAAEMQNRVIARAVENKENMATFQPLTIERKLSPEVVATFMERRNEFPGVIIVTESTRLYPQGKVAGSVIGYVGQVTAEELKDPAFGDYLGGEMVGKNGIEQFYEQYLRGKPGSNEVVVDPWGRKVADSKDTPPQPGYNIKLTLDTKLQKVAEEALAKQMEYIRSRNDPQAKPVRGALVAQDVRTGAILAMASVPTYDPNSMLRDLTPAEWAEIQNIPGYYLNWAIQSWMPGSTFKMATAFAGLEHGYLNRWTTIQCPAEYWKYDRPKNWTGYDQGPANVTRALAISCNPFFWEVADDLKIDNLHKYYDKLGIGKKTGIDLPGESPGNNPSKESYGPDRWFPGNVLAVAIGQGDTLVSPLQLANYVAAISMNGVRYKPYLVDEMRSASGELIFKTEPTILDRIEAKPETFKIIQDGMKQGVTASDGTPHRPLLGFPIPVAGKTGSAQTGKPWDDGTSIVYAPADNPEIVISVIIEGGGKGSWATSVSRRVLAQYFNVYPDIYPSEIETYRDESNMPLAPVPPTPTAPRATQTAPPR